MLQKDGKQELLGSKAHLIIFMKNALYKFLSYYYYYNYYIDIVIIISKR